MQRIIISHYYNIFDITCSHTMSILLRTKSCRWENAIARLSGLLGSTNLFSLWTDKRALQCYCIKSFLHGSKTMFKLITDLSLQASTNYIAYFEGRSSSVKINFWIIKYMISDTIMSLVKYVCYKSGFTRQQNVLLSVLIACFFSKTVV